MKKEKEGVAVGGSLEWEAKPPLTQMPHKIIKV